MRWEFFGSFLVFGLSFLIVRFRGALRIAALAIAVLACHRWLAHDLEPFLAGMVLAAILPRQRIELPASISVALLLAAIYLGGYIGKPIGAYSPLYPVFGGDYSTVRYVEIGAALLAVFAIETSPMFRRRLSGRIAAGLGKLSFPLYLIHIPVLCSTGCLTLVSLDGILSHTAGRDIAAIVTIVTAFAVAIPLMVFNDWWVERLNSLVRRTIRPRETLARAQEIV